MTSPEDDAGDRAAAAQAIDADEAKLDPDGELRPALGRAPNADELTLWAGMASDRREAALQRIAVLRRWTEEPGELTAAEAAEQADVAVSRFYEIASAWRADPTLASLGTYVKKPGRKGPRLSGEAVNRIQALLPRIVGANSKMKVGAIAGLIQVDPSLEGMKLPHLNTLRTMIEREKRRLRAEELVGLRPGLDAVACNLVRPDGRHHVVFAVVDRTARFILGFSVGDVRDSRGAYRRAAADALDRINRNEIPGMPWADKSERVDVIIGDDEPAWQEARSDFRSAEKGIPFELIIGPRRYGRYLRIVAGTTIGDLRIWPARTDTDEIADGSLTHTDAEATTAIEVEVAKHNAEVMAQSVADGADRPAPITMRILKFIARQE